MKIQDETISLTDSPITVEKNGYPSDRPRRMRFSPALRRMVRETSLAPDDFIYPLFVTHGQDVRHEISSMPGVYQWSPDRLAKEVKAAMQEGIPAVLLFGLPAHKDETGSSAYDSEAPVQAAVRAIKRARQASDEHAATKDETAEQRRVREIQERIRRIAAERRGDRPLVVPPPIPLPVERPGRQLQVLRIAHGEARASGRRVRLRVLDVGGRRVDSHDPRGRESR